MLILKFTWLEIKFPEFTVSRNESCTVRALLRVIAEKCLLLLSQKVTPQIAPRLGAKLFFRSFALTPNLRLTDSASSLLNSHYELLVP